MSLHLFDTTLLKCTLYMKLPQLQIECLIRQISDSSALTTWYDIWFRKKTRFKTLP